MENAECVGNDSDAMNGSIATNDSNAINVSIANGITNNKSITSIKSIKNIKSVIRRPISQSCHRCAFTGYRPAKMPFGYDEGCPSAMDFKKRLRDTIETLIQMNYGHFISGGAMGMDIMAAEAVLALKQKYSNITLEMAIPFEEQAIGWSQAYRERWQRCVDEADMITVLSRAYTRGCLFARNQYMVTQADLLLACFDGKEGGTKHTVEYAKQNGCQVCLIPPVVPPAASAHFSANPAIHSRLDIRNGVCHSMMTSTMD